LAEKRCEAARIALLKGALALTTGAGVIVRGFHPPRRCGRKPSTNQCQRAKGKPRHVAIRALAFKWLRILFLCWQARRP